MTKQIQIDIVSDTICPWCFIGKRRLEKAIANTKAAHPDAQIEFNIDWQPFQLDPTLPKEGYNKREHYIEKFGKARAQAMFPRMEAVGKDDGINFSYGGTVSNTLDSHRLIAFAKSKGKQDAVVEELFHNYFEQEKNIADEEVLKAAGVKAGLDAAEVEVFLKSGELAYETKGEIERNMRRNIHGVPNFTINKRYQLSGAQEPETFQEIFEQVISA
ncbi:hypothetical protein BZG36_05189 [Bifiguratus adelaidae]|uniref:DSBA-like thioredoxin domain-containing protein n=1 Tax=Bifiguratus adelaidae TaxID=1938954 RepID=A0A261XU74_9FUNG|nr:hypothetical protein BZG36_05189 [Bifiguratus adelaidae]